MSDRENWKRHPNGDGSRRVAGHERAMVTDQNVWKRNRLAWMGLEKVSHTVFVDNLPNSMTKPWL